MTTAIAEDVMLRAVTVGPTWERDDSGEFLLPERTLGWQIIEWCWDYLLQPDGPNAGEGWSFTDEQARWLLWWYEVNQRGRFVRRRGVLRRLKGWGKDPLAAVLCAIEMVGPCRFGGWADDGEPIAVPHDSSWVQIAAVSKEQTRNTMTCFGGLFSPRALSEFDIDLGKEIIYAHDGKCRIEAVTSSPRALEGGRPTFAIANETQHWLENNEGREMSRVMARNAAKSRDGASRRLAITNAHDPGEDSVAQRDWEAWVAIQSGKSRARGLMYDSLEAPADTLLADDGAPCRVSGCGGELRPVSGVRLECNRCGQGGTSLIAGLLIARGDSVWVDPERLEEEIYDPETTPSTSRRFYLNQLVAAEDAWVAPTEWDAIEDPDHVVPKGGLIALAFDGSISDDHSALVGCEIETGHIFTLGVWDPEDYGGEAPRELIDAAVDGAFASYDVVGFYSDLHPWESYVDAWTIEYGDRLCVKAASRHAVAWDMRGRTKDFTVAAETLNAAIVAKDFTHDANPMARQHVHNARRRPNNFGVSIGKEHRESARKIDFAVTAVLARLARQDYMALPESRKRKKRTGKASFFN